MEFIRFENNRLQAEVEELSVDLSVSHALTRQLENRIAMLMAENQSYEEEIHKLSRDLATLRVAEKNNTRFNKSPSAPAPVKRSTVGEVTPRHRQARSSSTSQAKTTSPHATSSKKTLASLEERWVPDYLNNRPLYSELTPSSSGRTSDLEYAFRQQREFDDEDKRLRSERQTVNLSNLPPVADGPRRQNGRDNDNVRRAPQQQRTVGNSRASTFAPPPSNDLDQRERQYPVQRSENVRSSFKPHKSEYMAPGLPGEIQSFMDNDIQREGWHATEHVSPEITDDQLLAMKCAAEQQHLLSDMEYAARRQREFDEEDKFLKSQLANLMPSTFDCSVCLETFPEDYVASIDACGHQFCRDCMKGHISTKLMERRFPILCPVCATDKKKDPMVIDNLLAQQVGINEDENAIWRELETVPFSVEIQCRKCKRAVFVDRKEFEETKIITCPLPGCDCHWCKNCQQILPSEDSEHSCDGTLELQNLVKQQGWKWCPGCGTPVQKISGCNHMTCGAPGCHISFCYGCGQQSCVCGRR